MRQFYASGTLGDAYVILCKIYHTAKKSPVLVRHYTTIKELAPSIMEVYSLVPGIAVDFRDNGNRTGITGQFIHHKPEGRIMRQVPDDDGYGLSFEPHPRFDLGNSDMFALPNEYVTMQLESGANPGKSKRIDEKEVQRIVSSSGVPVVILGKDSAKCPDGDGVLDLRGKTKIREVVKIISKSAHFYGCLGFMSLVALSQRIYSTLYRPRYYKDKHAFESRIQPVAEWRRYVA